MKQKIISISLLAFMIFSFIFTQVNVYATESQIDTDMAESTIDPENPGDLPIISTEEAKEKIEGKAYNIISLVQTVGKPVCIIGFIIGILAAVFGALGKKGAGNGLIASFIAAFAYICINYAQEIVLFIQSYILS